MSTVLGYPAEAVALGFVLVIALCAIVFIIFLQFQILSDARGGYNLIVERSETIQKSGQELEGVRDALDVILMRLNTLKVNYEREPHSGAVISPEAIRALERLLQSFPSATLKELEMTLAEMRRLLAGIQLLQPEAFMAWMQDNRESITKVLGHDAHTVDALTQMRESLHEAEPVVEQWVGDAKLHSEGLDSPKYKVLIDQQQRMLKASKARAIEAESQLKQVTNELNDLLRAQSEQKGLDSGELEQLRTQNAQLSQERSSLIRHLEQLSGEIKRTRLEKKFIEDRFVDMDERNHEETESVS